MMSWNRQVERVNTAMHSAQVLRYRPIQLMAQRQINTTWFAAFSCDKEGPSGFIFLFMLFPSLFVFPSFLYFLDFLSFPFSFLCFTRLFHRRSAAVTNERGLGKVVFVDSDLLKEKAAQELPRLVDRFESESTPHSRMQGSEV
jgi:hypothetical protein